MTMTTGKAITAQIKNMLNEAQASGKYLYCASTLPNGNPLRIIGVKTVRGLTIADTMNGGTIPVSSANIGKFYIQ